MTILYDYTKTFENEGNPWIAETLCFFCDFLFLFGGSTVFRLAGATILPVETLAKH